MVFIDTSALFASLDGTDQHHQAAVASWSKLLEENESLLVSSYVLIEITALAARHLGFEAVRAFQLDIVPLLNVAWIDAPLHERAVVALLAASRRQLSLVDCASFELMRERGIESAFAFDVHFREHGFRCLP